MRFEPNQQVRIRASDELPAWIHGLIGRVLSGHDKVRAILFDFSEVPILLQVDNLEEVDDQPSPVQQLQASPDSTNPQKSWRDRPAML